ncbi:MAG: monovalent cation/H(+) antiporter subunit G [Ilumatobacteraceae bacterium]
MSLLVDVLTAVFVVVGVALALVAAIGLHRLGDTRARMHAATKPATLGVLCCATGAVLQVDDVSSITKVVVVVVLQVITAPVGAHMLSRAITIDADQAG